MFYYIFHILQNKNYIYMHHYVLCVNCEPSMPAQPEVGCAYRPVYISFLSCSPNAFVKQAFPSLQTQ